MDRLKKVIANIQNQQAVAKAHGRTLKGYCSRTTRLACEAVGLKYPRAISAIQSFKMMEADPSHYGYKTVEIKDGLPVTLPCLVYFKPSSSPYGHVGILSRDDKGVLTIYSATNEKWNDRWKARLVGAFVPMDD